MTNLTGWLGPAHYWVVAAHVTFVIFWLSPSVRLITGRHSLTSQGVILGGHHLGGVW